LRITAPEAYTKAIDRIDELRSAGKTAENDAELAELEGAVAAYEALPDEPDESKGKPTPNPFGNR